ncbi:hypothetical protein CONLIGDRAFT_685960 [Coniochaeta ligniaria NRRL 30616]|uniref:Uncharacterized protein n=1 Tax=Coniochaeta ligniaria NRRL 30616 TaxID=1408157 RepID=A0A1J7ITB6_9PEZI|nr:hypothetical protein CONLIGDRAFT_685960 [Coniochaeta ligniaria NRRL 30616]
MGLGDADDNDSASVQNRTSSSIDEDMADEAAGFSAVLAYYGKMLELGGDYVLPDKPHEVERL